MTWFDAALRWYAISLAAGLAFAPPAHWLFRRLPGHGAWFARPVGLLALVWPAWLLASVTPIPFDSATLWATLAVGAAASWGRAIASGQVDRPWLRSLRDAELVFLAAFLAFLVYKGFTPRITGTEKPMDVAFLAATMRATDMPPPDQWYAGEPINYYYLGYLLNGALARLTDIPSWIAYNLALASTFAMALTAVAGLAHALVARTMARLAGPAAVAAAFLVVIGGNLRTIIRLLDAPRATWDAFYFDGPGWEASRVVVDHGWGTTGETINEFPSFSFVLGDLHPHVTALPFTIVALAIAVGFFLRNASDGGRANWRAWAELGVAGGIVGALYPLNSWDFPTYLAATGIALALAAGPSVALAARLAVFGVAAVVAWLPFWARFVPFSGGDVDAPRLPIIRFVAKNVAPYDGPWTDLGEYLTVFGMLWLIGVVFLIVETASSRDSVEAVREHRGQLGQASIVAVALVAVVAVALPMPVLVLAGLPFALAVRLIVRRRTVGPDLTTVVLILYAAGFGITIATEFFYIRDTFNSRFNTLFKLYYQAWTFLAIAGAIAAVLLWQRFSRSDAGRLAYAAAATAIAVAGISYPVVAIHSWVAVPQINPDQSWRGLDGLAQHGEAPDVEPAIAVGLSPDDVAAIRWLNEHAHEGDVLLEAAGCQYEISYELPTSRFSTFTGVPTVIGWGGAEDQWRGGQPELRAGIAARQDDVAAMYADPDPSRNPLFDRYGITLLVVGDLERYGTERCAIAGAYPGVDMTGYPGAGWILVYEGGGTRIYRRQ